MGGRLQWILNCNYLVVSEGKITSLAGDPSSLVLICQCLLIHRRIKSMKTNWWASKGESQKYCSKSYVQCLPAVHLKKKKKTGLTSHNYFCICADRSPVPKGRLIYICVHLCHRAGSIWQLVLGFFFFFFWSIMDNFLLVSVSWPVILEDTPALHFYNLKHLLQLAFNIALHAVCHVGCLVKNDCFM